VSKACRPPRVVVDTNLVLSALKVLYHAPVAFLLGGAQKALEL
jgi:hypothetical protein